MAFHKTNFGSFGGGLKASMSGYVPEAGDDAWDDALAVDHGGQRTHDEDGELTEYGEWWEEEGFPQWRNEAVKATAEANSSLSEWQESNR